jgi:benzoylformate decarboxylase
VPIGRNAAVPIGRNAAVPIGRNAAVPIGRNAAQAFVGQLIAGGTEVVFGNPGTTEYAVLDAIAERPELDFVLALHEGVAVSSAIGYARASGKVGVVEVHAAPGLGNALGMIYDAWAGETPLLVYVGQTEQSANYLEPLLSGELAALAKPVTKWAYEIRTPDEVPAVVRRAMKVATTEPCGPVMLSLPMDISEQPCSAPIEAASVLSTQVRPDPAAIDAAVDLILAANAPLVVPGDSAARAGAVDEVSGLARLIGAPIRGGFMFETCVPLGDPLEAERLHNAAPETKQVLAGHDLIIAVGGKLFKQLFPEPGDQVGGARVLHVGLNPWELGKSDPSLLVFGDEKIAVAELISELDRRVDDEQRAVWGKRRVEAEREIREAAQRALERDRQSWGARPMSPARAAYEIGQALPVDVCVSDESLTSSGAVARYLPIAAGNWYRGRGGGIGEGLPMALGVKVARPGQPVLGLVSDGAAMYAPTALWTAAHHGIPLVWIVFNNRIYRILKENAIRRRPDELADVPSLGTDLGDPPIDFVGLATSFGIQAQRVEDPDTLGDVVRQAFSTNQPSLIEVVIS